ILEDPPDPQNAVTLGPDGASLTVRYVPSAETNRRRQLLRRLTRRAFQRFRPIRLPAMDRAALGHVCGTCRFGVDPSSSVVDRSNRVHHLDNVYIADASFFPTSGGTNPALTIAANALRMAETLG